jgi:tetratricopeptide (TPR) repeat protein
MKHPLPTLALLTALTALTGACATTNARAGASSLATTSNGPPTRSVRGSEFRVVGRADGTGDAYDARLLFDRAAAALQARRFDEALADYDRLVREFAQSTLVGAAQFNRGQCFQATNRPQEAIEAYTLSATAAQGTNNDLARDAWFRVAVVAESASRAADIVTATDRVLAIPRVSLVDRVEALARQAAAKLATGDRAGALRAAQDAVSLAPTPETVSALGDDTFIAQARFVLAELSRTDAAAVAIRIDDLAGLDLAVERRVQHVTHAHVLYNDAIRIGNPHWAAASGYAIGEMYRALYGSIVEAPLPCDWEAPAIRIYRERTGRRLRMLLQGALRAWEATIDMARRNAIADNAWVRRADEQVESMRRLVLNGPDPALLQRSANCIPATTPTTTGPTSAGNVSASPANNSSSAAPQTRAVP